MSHSFPVRGQIGPQGCYSLPVNADEGVRAPDADEGVRAPDADEDVRAPA